MSASRSLHYNFTLVPTGKEAQMQLAGLAVQSLLFGTYITLALAMFYLLRRRVVLSSSASKRHPANGRLLAGLGPLTAALTGHWVCLVIRAFKAFIYWHDGQQASLFFATVTSRVGLVIFAFHGATGFIADVFVIARLFIIWDYNRPVVIFPLICLVGFFITAIGNTYAFSVSDGSVPATLVSVHRWRLGWTISSLCINFYCTALVAWQLGRFYRRMKDHSVKSVLIVTIESAALYTSIVLIAQISFETANITTYFFTDCIPYIGALSAVLVHARAAIGSAPVGRSSRRELQDHDPGIRITGRQIRRNGDVEQSGGGDGSVEVKVADEAISQDANSEA